MRTALLAGAAVLTTAALAAVAALAAAVNHLFGFILTLLGAS